MSQLRPITLRAAQLFVRENHRHNEPPHGHKFSIGLADKEELIGVVTVGQPIARHQCDGYTAEVTRCCVLDGYRNANSKLYAAAIRAAFAMGYQRIITYTLPDESGASLKAVGFRVDGITKVNLNGWNMPGRPRKQPERYPKGPKVRWVRNHKTNDDEGVNDHV
jgi:hypothetical protein